MTATEMKYEFEVRADLVSNSQAPGLEDDEIDIFLNLGQDKLVEELYSTTGTKFLNDIISTLDVQAAATYTEITNAKAYSWTTMDENLVFFVNGVVLLNRTNPQISVAEWVECELIDKSIAHNFAETTFNTPWFEKPKIFLEDELIVIMGDSYTTISGASPNLKFEYIRKPVRIDITDNPSVECELRQFLHKDVVEKAVEIAMVTYNIQTSDKVIQSNKAI